MDKYKEILDVETEAEDKKVRDAREADLKRQLAAEEEGAAVARSGVVDASQTRVSGGRLIKVLIWFDNEWGYANRMLDVALYWIDAARAGPDVNAGDPTQ